MNRYSLRLRSASGFPRSYSSSPLTEEVLRDAVPAVMGYSITPFAVLPSGCSALATR